MKRNLGKKLSALDPRFRHRITELLDSMHESISLLYEAAIHDEKTGVYNNKFFETMVTMELEKAKRGQQKLSLIIVDIDFFKKINDTYGHLKADDLLLRLAQLLEGTARKSDIVARFGGEEFVILLPETNLNKAKRFANRLKKLVHEDKILKKHKLTISGGIAQYKQRDNQKRLMQRADKGLYQAKQKGRDRFEVQD